MEDKQSERSNGNDSSSLSDDNASMQCPVPAVSPDKRHMSFDQLMLEKRRETNRLSARRCRKRRREEIQHLELKRRQLEAESKQLAAEKVRLQAEFEREVSGSTAAPDTASQGLGLQQWHVGPSDEQGQILRLLELQQQQQQQQHLIVQHQNIPGNTASRLNPNIGLLSSASTTTSSSSSTMGLGVAVPSFSMWPNLRHLTPAYGLDLSRLAYARSLVSSGATAGEQFLDAISFLHQLHPSSYPFSFMPTNEDTSIDRLASIHTTAAAGASSVRAASISDFAAEHNYRNGDVYQNNEAARHLPDSYSSLLSREPPSSTQPNSKFGNQGNDS